MFFAVPGIVFSTTPSGSFVESIQLSAGANGAEPFGLRQAADGKLYGFKVLTANFIRVTVPAGASTGKIAVTNAGEPRQAPRTSSSNKTMRPCPTQRDFPCVGYIQNLYGRELHRFFPQVS